MFKRLFQITFALLAIVLTLLIGFRAAAFLRETETPASIEHTGKAVQTSLGAINVTTTGTDGPIVLLLHGTGAWGGLWQETADALSQAGFQAHAMDLPPFGFSDHDPARDYSRSKQARRVLALAETFPRKPILVAHSFGASAGVEAALQNPDAFSGLVIVSGALGLGSHENAPTALPWPASNAKLREFAVSLTATNPLATRFLLRQMLHRKDQASRSHADILRLPLARKGSTTAISHWSASLLLPPQNALSTRPEPYESLPLQTAVIWGDKDSVTPLPQGEALHQLIPGSTLHVMPDVGHIPQIEDPASFQTLLIKALRRISGGVD